MCFFGYAHVEANSFNLNRQISVVCRLMQTISMLLPSTCALIDQLDSKLISAQLSLNLQNIRKIFEGLSKISLFENSQPDSQKDSILKKQAGEIAQSQQTFQQLLQTLTSQKQLQNQNLDNRYSEKDLKSENLDAKAINEVYDQILLFLRNSWSKMRRQREASASESNQKPQKYFQPLKQEMLDLLISLRNNLKYLMIGHSEKEIDTDFKSKNKSDCDGPSLDFRDQSSVRSLLTEKLKQYQSINNDDDISCEAGKIVVKNSWIMNEMKMHSRDAATEPLNNLSDFSEASLGQNTQSVGAYSSILPKAHIKNRNSSLRPIYKEIQFDQACPKERKVKKQRTCAECAIY